MTKVKQKVRSKASIYKIFERLDAAFPDAKTELNCTNPYTLLVAVVLSAQATDVGVNKATERLFKLADNPKKMAALGVDKVKECISNLNFNSTKAKNVIKLSQILVETFNSQVPQTHAELVTLPGVGNKTANVVLNEAFGHPTLAVDTHIFRVAHRLDLAAGNTPDAVEHGLHKIVPGVFKQKAHIQLLLHGRYTCKARRPDCYRGIVQDLCHWPDKHLYLQEPVAKKKA